MVSLASPYLALLSSTLAAVTPFAEILLLLLFAADVVVEAELELEFEPPAPTIEIFGNADLPVVI